MMNMKIFRIPGFVSTIGMYVPGLQVFLRINELFIMLIPYCISCFLAL